MKDISHILGSEKNLVLINNPVDGLRIQNLARLYDQSVEEYYKDKNYIYLVAAGRLIEQKGFQMLIAAIALIDNPKIRLAILGHGPLEEKLISLIEHYKLQGQVNLLGYQKNPYNN